MRVGYVRVSTDQAHQLTSVERQVATFKTMGCDLILVERESGRYENRPEYQKLINKIRLGEVREVIASRCDRLNRNSFEMRYFYNLCMELGVAWTFTDEPELNSSSPWGVEMRGQKAYEAQQESERLGRRQEKAYVHAENYGKAIARTELLGYVITPQRQYKIDFLLPSSSNLIGFFEGKPYARGEIARVLIDLYLNHRSLRQALRHWKDDFLRCMDTSIGDQKVVGQLLKFAGTSLQEWLRNPVLRGHTAYGKYRKVLHGDKLERKKYVALPPHEWRIQWNTHPDQALISDSEWNAIEKILETNQSLGRAIAQSRRKPETPISLSTILRCKHCQLRFVCSSTVQKGKFYRYYYCCGRKEFHCKSAGIGEVTLVAEIINAIIPKAKQMVAMIEQAKTGVIAVNPDQLALLQHEAQEAEKKYQLTGIREFQSLAQQLNLRIAQIEASRAKEVESLQHSVTLLRGLQNRNYWESLPPADLHRYLRGLVKDCWIDSGRVVEIDLDL